MAETEGHTQRLVLIIAILASFVAFLDGSIVNVALPAIQRNLGGGLAVQQWIVDAYLLTLGSLILIAGSLSDLIGRKQILRLGLLGFGIASLLCAVAPNDVALIIFRGLQGIAGALLVPSSLALIISSFSGPAQGKAIGSWTGWTGISFIIGPLLGGFLIDFSSWRWIFAINIVPIAITLYLLQQINVPKKAMSRSSVDILGAVLCALGLGGPVFALIEQPQYGWGDPLIYLPLVAGVLLLGTFLWHEKCSSKPMLPLGIFRNHNFSVGNVATLAIYAGLAVSTFLIVLFLQQVTGYSALRAGLSLLPVTLILFLLSPRVGALSGKFGPRWFMGTGPVVAGLGFLLIAGMPANVNYWTQLLPGVLIFGLGLAITVAPLTSAILGDVPQEQAGIASAINNAVARIAGLVAVAAVGAFVAARFTSNVMNKLTATFPSSALDKVKDSPLIISPPAPYQHSAAFHDALTTASVHAFHDGMLVIAALLIAGGVVSASGIRNHQPAK